jgi:WD40 repeat protein
MARLWNIETGKIVQQYPDRPNGIGIFSVEFSPDNQYVVIGCQSAARLYDRTSGKFIREFENTPNANFNSVQFSPGGNLLLTSNHLIAILWDVVSGNVLHEFSFGKVIDEAKFSPDGELILTISSFDVRIWATKTYELLGSFHWPTDYVQSAALTPSNGKLVTGSNGGIIRVWATELERST